MTGAQTSGAYDARAKQRRLRDERFWYDDFSQMRPSIGERGVIDVGCGIGGDSRLFVKENITYVGVDSSPAMIEEAKRRWPTATFFVGDQRQLSFAPQSFDALWSVNALLHVAYEEINETLTGIRSLVRIGSPGFFVMREGQGRSYVVDSDGTREFMYYSREEFAGRLEQAGHHVVSSRIDPRGVFGSHHSQYLTYHTIAR